MDELLTDGIRQGLHAIAGKHKHGKNLDISLLNVIIINTMSAFGICTYWMHLSLMCHYLYIYINILVVC